MVKCKALLHPVYPDGVRGHVKLGVGVQIDAVNIRTAVVRQTGEQTCKRCQMMFRMNGWRILDFSQCFGLFYTINYGRFFILVLLGHEIEKKGLKISSSKKVRIQGWLKLAQFLLIEIWGLPTLHSFISGISPSIFKILVPILVQIS